MRPDLIIFDCDGVLVDTEGLGTARLAEWLTIAGYPIEAHACRRRFEGMSMKLVQAEIEALGVPLGADFVDRWNAGLPDLFAAGVDEVPGVRDFIGMVRASAVPYCVASSARVSKMHITLGHTGLLPFFEHAMFSASMVPRGKPFPDLFLHAAEKMGAPPETCVVIEDSVAGTKAGRAAGMTVYSYAGDPFADRAALAAAGGIVFGAMSELPGLISLA